MAQDFTKAFKLGEDPNGINSSDADGVALAAIQGVQEKDARITQLEKELEELRQAVSELARSK